jgi:NhaP-type Na+/H+ and K+/H+ antiporter
LVQVLLQLLLQLLAAVGEFLEELALVVHLVEVVVLGLVRLVHPLLVGSVAVPALLLALHLGLAVSPSVLLCVCPSQKVVVLA